MIEHLPILLVLIIVKSNGGKIVGVGYNQVRCNHSSLSLTSTIGCMSIPIRWGGDLVA